jgi:predicted small lipoprotein YifL
MKKSISTFAAIAVIAIAFTSCGGSKPQSTVVNNERAAVDQGLEALDRLETMCNDMQTKEIPCGIGTGKSNDLSTARSVSTDDARRRIAISMEGSVKRISEEYAENVNAESKRFWEEGTKQVTNVTLRGVITQETKTVFNEKTKMYEVYILMLVNPKVMQEAFAASAKGNEEMELRVKSSEMQKKLDAAVAEYETKYKR